MTTADQAIRALTLAQRRVFRELLAASGGPLRIPDRRRRRPADALVAAGWAARGPGDGVYRVTALGMLVDGPVVCVLSRAGGAPVSP